MNKLKFIFVHGLSGWGSYDKQYQKRLGEKAEAKYYRNHDKKTVQANLIDLVLGSEA